MMMEAKTLKALRGSINKWEKILAGTGTDQGPGNCPLCKLFYTGELKPDCCVGCPVSKKTGARWCLETPYDDWYVAKRDYFMDQSSKNAATCMRIARAEIKFLKGLLP